MAENKKFDWSHEMILIAEDDVYNFILLKKVFFKTGAKILHASNGNEAYQMLMGIEGITIAIIDLIMPYISGMDIVSKCRSIFPDILFVAYTADVIRFSRDKCEQAGFNLYIPKPILPQKLLCTMDEALLLRSQFSNPK